MLSIENLDLKSNTIIAAEIKAVNVGQFTSETITTLIQEHNLAPPLTGYSANITRINDILLLDWADVFNTDPDILHRYGLIIGSRDGHTDIADVAHLSKHVYDVTIPPYTLISPIVNELFVRIV
ncbi:hypothetical protein DPMN_175851 [Dreissena polymorpha]|uniref:Uncharacterized protein n=1 Tax=Dreissena polymorpha TaxID=45954 RepID=A0A9D4IIM4_DREPO|nr:hypothetical protein DPMN_175851 [Dreissena polymorpha]